ncbi:hypothetical protein CaCOL14_004251 [Colletotrichum acutatum]
MDPWDHPSMRMSTLESIVALSQLHKQDVGEQVAYGHAERAPISEQWTVASTTVLTCDCAFRSYV